jgi:hypothetical protein
LDRDALHRLFWRRRDERDRLVIHVGDLARSLAVSYAIADKAVIAMREEGRLRAVAWKRSHTRVYQVADPTQWNPRRPTTHARPAAGPVWG